MKKNAITLLSSIALLTCSTKCFAMNDNDVVTCELLPYFRLDSGLSKLEKVKGARVQNKDHKLTSQVGAIAGSGIGVGLNFGDKVRSDITWSHHINPLLQTENASYISMRKPSIDAYFFNLYYELGNMASIFNPYAGAGIGVAAIKDKLTVLPLRPGVMNISENINRKNNFAYKFIVGSAFDLNEAIKFDLSYNYSDYGKTKSKVDMSNNQIGKTHYKAHMISAGLRFGI